MVHGGPDRMRSGLFYGAGKPLLRTEIRVFSLHPDQGAGSGGSKFIFRQDLQVRTKQLFRRKMNFEPPDPCAAGNMHA
jgi:hypothetical protein